MRDTNDSYSKYLILKIEPKLSSYYSSAENPRTDLHFIQNKNQSPYNALSAYRRNIIKNTYKIMHFLIVIFIKVTISK